MTIRWGFLGAGYVASRAMAPAVHSAASAVLEGVASRDESRSFALEPRRVFATYQDLLDDDAIDAVYISLTNAQHFDWVNRSLRAGKHVLCEKPLALDAPQVAEMQACAEECERLLVEAVWVRWHPRFRRFAELVRSGDIGDQVRVTSAFTFQSDMTDNYRLRPDMGGGALLDVGCYQAHAWMAISSPSDEVEIIAAEQLFGQTGVDITTRATVRIGGSVNAVMECSFAESARQVLRAEGHDGVVQMDQGEAFTSWREPTTLRIDGHIEMFDSCDAFVSMVDNVSRHLEIGEPIVVPELDSWRVAHILDDITVHAIVQ